MSGSSRGRESCGGVGRAAPLGRRVGGGLAFKMGVDVRESMSVSNRLGVRTVDFSSEVCPLSESAKMRGKDM